MKLETLFKFDSESGQSIFRFTCACLIVIYAEAASQSTLYARSDYGLVGVHFYLAFSFLWIFIVRFSVFKTSHRRIAATVLDQLIPAVAFYTAGQVLAAVAWAPALAAVGSGLRYGARYALLSSAIALPSLACVIFLSPAWQGTSEFSIAVLAITVIFPLYAAILGERLRIDMKEIESKAVRLEIETRHDYLTGIQNRMGLVDLLRRKNLWEATSTKKFALINLDLDGFKAVNDCHGHARGDEVLKIVAQTVTSCLRSSDVVARLGGDEFCIYLQDISNPKDAEDIANHILAAIRRIDIQVGDLRLGASMGICVLPHPQLPTIKDAFLAADNLMYEAKRGGKNQFRTFQATPVIGC